MTGAPLTPADALWANTVYLCREMGWTIDYVKGLDLGTFYRVLMTVEAQDKAKARLEKRGQGGE